MAFPVPGLTFIRCADTSPAGTTIQDFLNAIYTALADKNDLNAADLEELSNRLGRMAWDKART